MGWSLPSVPLWTCGPLPVTGPVGPQAPVVMEIPGHSRISATLNIHAHLAPEIAREAASRLEGALWSGE